MLRLAASSLRIEERKLEAFSLGSVSYPPVQPVAFSCCVRRAAIGATMERKRAELVCVASTLRWRMKKSAGQPTDFGFTDCRREDSVADEESGYSASGRSCCRDRKGDTRSGAELDGQAACSTRRGSSPSRRNSRRSIDGTCRSWFSPRLQFWLVDLQLAREIGIVARSHDTSGDSYGVRRRLRAEAER